MFSVNFINFNIDPTPTVLISWSNLAIIELFLLSLYLITSSFILQYTLQTKRFFLYHVPVVSRKGWVLKPWSYLRAWTPQAIRSSQGSSRDFSEFLTVTVMILVLLNFLVWRSPVFTCFYSHLIISSTSFNLIYLTFPLVMVLLKLIPRFNPKTLPYINLITRFIIVTTTCWFFFLFSSSNLYTCVFNIELLNILAFVFLTINLFSLLMNDVTSHTRYSYSIIIFFWTSTISSILLFSTLIFFGVSGISLDWCNITSLQYFLIVNEHQTTLLTLVLIFLLVFFKTGLPPFFFWKSLLFSNVSLSFLIFYIILYYVLLFSYLLFIFLPFFLPTLFCAIYNSIYFFLPLLMLVVSSFILQRIYTLNLFLAFSSFATSALLFFLVVTTSFSTLFNKTIISESALLYFLLYLTSLILFFSLTVLHAQSQTNGESFSWFGLIHNSTTHTGFNIKNTWFRSSLIVLLSSMAALPPFPTFFAKLHVIIYLNFLPFPLISVLIFIFLFVMLVFYFQNSRFVLIQTGKMYGSYNSYAHTLPSVYSSKNSFGNRNYFYLLLKLTCMSFFVISCSFFFYPDLIIILHWWLN